MGAGAADALTSGGGSGHPASPALASGRPQAESQRGAVTDDLRVSSVLRRFAGTLVGEYELDDVLSSFGADIAEVLGCAGAGAMLVDEEGHLHFVSTSDPVLGGLEKLQIAWGEGPCLLAYRTGEVVIASDLATDPRFPSFGPRAIEEGMRAVYSFPMHLQGTAVGALNLYTGETGELSDEAIELGRTFADVATIYMVHARDLADHAELTAGLQKALDTRIVVEQAKGFLVARNRIEPRAAFDLLRGYARSHSIRVHAVASDLLAGRLRPDQLLTTRRDG